jgi:hypothetical protein
MLALAQVLQVLVVAVVVKVVADKPIHQQKLTTHSNQFNTAVF